MKVLVCGGRDYSDWERLCGALDALHKRKPITLVIHGGALGADELAGRWAKSRGIATQMFAADWERLGRKAGPIRNQQMLAEGKPDRVVVFRGGKGTEDMTNRALRAKVRCLFVDPRPTSPLAGTAQVTESTGEKP